MRVSSSPFIGTALQVGSGDSVQNSPLNQPKSAPAQNGSVNPNVPFGTSTMQRVVSSESTGGAQSIVARSVHGAEGGNSPAWVNTVAEAMVSHEVRLISAYLKDHIFAAHRQREKSVPPNVSRAELNKLNEHNAGVARNNRQLDDIADSRARILQREGETLSDIADTLAKAEKFDRLASRSSSAFRAIPFASAAILQYAKPEINKGNWLPTSLKPLAPLISGALSGVMDQIGTGVMNRVTGDAHYLKAAPEKLHDAMADSLKRNASGLQQKSVDMGVAIQGYTCLLYTSPSPRDLSTSRMPSSA